MGKSIISNIAKHLPLESLLKGAYAYSYTSYWRADPPYPIDIPQIGCFHESPNNIGVFKQVRGFSLTAFAAYIHFNGDGTFYEKGKLRRAGAPIADVNNKGVYTVEEDSTAEVFTGKFTVENVPGQFINHYFVMADDWKELHFMMLDTYNRQPVATGVLKKINKK